MRSSYQIRNFGNKQKRNRERYCTIRMQYRIDTQRNEYLENRQEMLQKNWFCGLSTQYETKKIYIYVLKISLQSGYNEIKKDYSLKI